MPARARPAGREPAPAAVLARVAAVSDSAKKLSTEVRAMGKIFADNQKVLVSMKSMIDTIAVSLERIQKQSKQISMLEDDSQKLFAGLNQVRGHADMVARINAQTARLQDEVDKIQKSIPEAADISRQVGDSMSSIQNNSQMIIKVAQRVDGVRDQLRDVAAKTDSLGRISGEIGQLRQGVESISARAEKLESGMGADELRAELDRVARNAGSAESLKAEIGGIREAVDGVSRKADRVDGLAGVIDGLRQQLAAVAEKAESASSVQPEIEGIKAKIDAISRDAGRIGGEIDSLIKRADPAELVGEGIRSVRAEVGSLRQSMADKTDTIEQKISALAGYSRSAGESSSTEVMALLKLSAFQSKIRMNAESKYGELRDIEAMAEQTREIIGLFRRVSDDAGGGVEIPVDVQQWAVSKIFDCADRWEIRFGDVFGILSSNIGRDRLKDMIRIQQIRDIYGIRAVDEIRGELGIP